MLYIFSIYNWSWIVKFVEYIISRHIEVHSSVWKSEKSKFSVHYCPFCKIYISFEGKWLGCLCFYISLSSYFKILIKQFWKYYIIIISIFLTTHNKNQYKKYIKVTSKYLGPRAYFLVGWCLKNVISSRVLKCFNFLPCLLLFHLKRIKVAVMV